MNQHFKKALAIIISVIIVIGISVGAAIIVNKITADTTTIKDGLSAYELALQYGYEGTVQEWLESLNGKSAYEIAKENGYSGSKSEWTASLKATAGKDGLGIKTAAFSDKNELLITLTDDTVLNLGIAQGKDGADGKDGTNGQNGVNGKDGISITEANINSDGQLVLSFSDGKSVNLDKVVGMNGTDGIGISSSIINTDGELVITYTNGQTANLGIVIGAKGDKGDQGEQGIQGIQGNTGADGVSVTKTEINQRGELIITLSDNTISNLGVVIGDKGDKGDKGDDGVDGVGIETIVIENGNLKITLTNDTTLDLGNIKGEKGDPGATGATGAQGVQGIQGEKGDKGATGENGLTPFINTLGNWQIGSTDTGVKAAGINGTNGTNGINGIHGTNGLTPFINASGNWQIGNDDTGIKAEGINGTNGDSAYDIAKKNGFVGTEEEWLASLKGEQGQQGIQGIQGVGVSEVALVNDELIITLSNGEWFNLGNIKGAKGDKGDTGAKGDKGEQGEQGIQGVSIIEVTLTAEGELSMKFSNGQVIPLGNIKGQDGTDGVGIANTEINADGELVITYTDGESKNLGSIKGPKGDKGDKGEQGPKGDKGDAGRDIAKTEIINGHLWVTYTDDLENPVDLGKVTEPEYNGTEGLEFYLLPDGTYGVKAGLTRYLENIVIPSIYRGKAVTTIMENGFEAMRNLKTITIPDSITTIEKYAFSDCAVLETANIPNSVTSIGAYAFNNCKSLIKITIPSNLTVIEEYTFYGCTGAVQNTIIIPESVTKIKPHALEISKDIGIFFEEQSSWSVTCDYTYSSRDNSSLKNSNYGGKVFTVSAKTTTNYSDYFAGKKLEYTISGYSWSFYFKSQECTWTKQ